MNLALNILSAAESAEADDIAASLLAEYGDPQAGTTGQTAPVKPVEQRPLPPVPGAGPSDLSFATAGRTAGRVVRDVAQGIIEAPSAAITGAATGFNEALDLIDTVGDELTQRLGGPAYTPERGLFWARPGEWNVAQGDGASADFLGGVRIDTGLPEPESRSGKFLQGVAQFLTGYATGGRALRGVKAAGAVGQAGKAAAQGAISDFAFFDGQEANLSALIQDTPLANPVTEYLAVNETTPELEGRLKRAAEGVGLGLLTDAFLTGVRSLRAAKRAKAADAAATKPDPAAQAQAEAEIKAAQYRELVGDPEGSYLRDLPPPPRDKLDEALADLLGAADRPRPDVDPDTRVGLNMARVNTPEDVARLITDVENLNQDALARSIGYRSWAEADAASGGIDGYKLLMEREAGRAFTDREALAARKVSLAAWATAREAATRHRAGPTPATAMAVQETWAKAFALHKELLGARAEAARALAVWRMTVDGADAASLSRAMDATFAGGSGKETADAIADRLLTIDPMRDPEAAARFLERSAGARTADMVAEAYQGALLSSPASQMTNLLGNSLNLAYAIAERAAAGRFARLLGEEGVEVGEAAAMSVGARAGLMDAFRYVSQRLRQTAEAAGANARGDNEALAAALDDAAKTREAMLEATGRGRKDEAFVPRITARNAGLSDTSTLGRAVNGLGALVRAPGTLMAFQDDLFKMVNHRAELHAEAFRRASAEVRDGALDQADLARRVKELVDDPDGDMLDAARRAAEERTFTAEPGPTARGVLALRSRMNDNGMGVPVGTIMLPFVNTPANMFGYTFRRTPLAPLFRNYKTAIEAGGAQKQLAETQVALGTMTLLLASDLALSGAVTGAAPTDPEQRQLWTRAGIQPYSIKVGDRWVQYNRLAPVGTILALGADLGQLSGETPLESDDERQNEWDEAFAASAGAVGNTLLNTSVMTGFADVMAYLGDPQRYGESYVGGVFANLLTPQIVRDVERVEDPYVREAANMVDMLRARVPGASEALPVRVDLWGNPIKQTSEFGGVYDAFIPIRVKGENVQPIDRELLRLKADVAMPDKELTVDGYRVSLRNRPDIYTDLVRTAAQDVRLPRYGDKTMVEFLNDLVTGKAPESELYEGMADTRRRTASQRDDEKLDYIQAVMSRYRDAARERIAEKYRADLEEMAREQKLSSQVLRPED